MSEQTGCPACAGAMPADQMGHPLQAAHAKHLPSRTDVIERKDGIAPTEQAQR